MTFWELLFWIFIAVVIYLVLKISVWVIFIIVIVLIVYYLVNLPSQLGNSNNIEGYQNVLQYPNSHSPAYLENKPPINVHKQLGANTGHSDYWYIPVEKHLDEITNGIAHDSPLKFNNVSEYCVHNHMKETGDLFDSIRECNFPTY